MSGISKVSIFNAALYHLGEGDRLISAEQGAKAVALNDRYPAVRDALIREYKWNFSKRRARLPALSAAPDFGFARQFAKPAGCLRVFTVAGEAADKWVAEGNYILTDLPAPLDIEYAISIDNPAEFDPIFAEVLAMDLAVAVSPIIGNKRTIRADLKDERARKMLLAKAADADEGIEDDQPEGDWVGSRLGW